MKRYWTGEKQLWQSFWLLFVCGYIAILIANLIIFGMIENIVGLRLIAFILLFVTFAYLTVSLVSVWKCSNNTKWKGWGWIARTIVFAAIFKATYTAYFLFSNQCCPVKVVKIVGLNPSFCYNVFAHNSLLSKGDSSHGPL